MCARAARAAANREFAQAHRIARFEHFGVGQPRVGHVRVNGVGPVGCWRGAAAAADRFVIAERRVAEQQVVHRPLAGGRQAERAEQHIDNALRVSTLPPTTAGSNLGTRSASGGLSRHSGSTISTGASTP